MIRRVLAGLGVVVALAGFAMLADPGLAARLSTSEAFLLPIGVLVLIQGYRVIRGRTKTRVEIARTGDPETEQDLVVPGDDFDATLGGIGRSGRGGRAALGYSAHRNHVIRNRDRVRTRLEAAAVATIRNKWGCPEERARQALADGTWTDDPHAAAFFTGDLEAVGLHRRLYYAFTAESRFQRRANHAAEAIADLAAADAKTVRREVIET